MVSPPPTTTLEFLSLHLRANSFATVTVDWSKGLYSIAPSGPFQITVFASEISSIIILVDSTPRSRIMSSISISSKILFFALG